ncbi:hypothetical protein [Agromyces lapidis]|uniref:LPXTG cell wall anchor domain-containing protein n=1 Tax=Agromyces lapidis TaxID=279574 RepID=A0ABV5STY0_9MICO|nr:hypothetical protein [Agromyces lapidis]
MTQMTPARRALVAVPASALILTAAFAAQPANAFDLDCTWTGAAADAAWSSAANWSGCAGAAPGDGDRLMFPTGPAVLDTVNDLFGTVFSNVRFEGGGYSVAGDPVETNFLTVSAPTTFDTDLELVHSAGEHLVHVAADLTVTAGHHLGFAQAPLAVSIVSLTNGAVIGANLGGSAERLELRGDGRLELGGDTYAGTVALEDGAVLACGGADCGAASGTLQVSDASRLEFTGDAVFPRPIELGPDGPTVGASIVTGPHSVSLDGGVDALSSASIAGGEASPLLLTGGLSIAAGATLGLIGSSELPVFATLISAPDAGLTIGTESSPGRLRIVEGQFGHDGATTVTGLGSELVAGDQIALGPVGGAPTTVQAGATLGVDATIVVGEHVRVDADSRVATVAPAATATFDHLELVGGGKVETLASPSAISLADVSGTGELHLYSDGPDAPILFDAGGTSSYVGATFAETGTVALNRDGAVPGDLVIAAADVTTVHTAHTELHDLIADTALVTIDGGELVLNDRERVGALAGGGGSLLLVDGESGLLLGGDGETAWAGSVRGGGTITHDGTGAQRFSGDWSELAAGSRLDVEQGTVAVDGSFADTLATVSARLEGTGTLGDIVLDSGRLAPGASPGCLGATGEVGGGAGTVEIELGGAEDCAFDRIGAATQTLADADWAVSFVDGFVPAEGQVFAVVTTSGPGNDPLPSEQFVVDGVTLERSWNGSEVLLTVIEVPAEEPAGPGDGDSGGASGSDADGSDSDGSAPASDLAETGVEPVAVIAGALALLALGALVITAARGIRRRA